MLQRVLVMTKGTKSELDAIANDNGRLYVSLDAGILDALQVQLFLGGGNAFGSEIVGMVVGHAEEVVTRILQQMRKAGRGTEGIAVRTSALGALATVEQCAFQIANGNGGLLQEGLDVAEYLFTIFGRQ